MAAIGLSGCTAAPEESGSGQLITVRPDEPTTLNWHDAGHLPDLYIVEQVYESLVTLDPKTGLTAPELAKEWVWDGDLTWTFTLEEGVKFHNGADLTAEDVVYSFGVLGDPDVGANNASSVSLVDTIRAVDDYTVEIVTTGLDPIFDKRILRAAIVDSETDAEEGAENINGTGPYTLVEWNPGNYIDLKAFPDYHQGAANIEDIRVVFRAESSVRAAMVQTGEAHFAWYVTPQEAKGAPVGPSVTENQIVWLRPNTLDHPSLKDLRVRQAMRYAVDMELASTTIFDGVVEPMLGNQNVPPGALGYKEGMDLWPFDMEKATELVAEAAADGIDVSAPMNIILRNGGGQFPGDAEFAEYVVSQWQSVGLTGAGITPLDTDAWVKQHTLEEGQPVPDLSYANGDNTILDMSGQADRYLLCDGRYSRFCDEEADELLNEAKVLAGEERDLKYQEAAAHLEDLFPMFNFGTIRSYFAHVPELDWTPDGREYPVFYNMKWK